jgi:NhaP-type Na+/H+ and K+/H+ antiporter
MNTDLIVQAVSIVTDKIKPKYGTPEFLTVVLITVHVLTDVNGQIIIDFSKEHSASFSGPCSARRVTLHL